MLMSWSSKNAFVITFQVLEGQQVVEVSAQSHDYVSCKKVKKEPCKLVTN
jgi:hypothetical protein